MILSVVYTICRLLTRDIYKSLKAEGRRQEGAGGRRQEAGGDSGRKAGGRRQEAGGDSRLKSFFLPFAWLELIGSDIAAALAPPTPISYF